MNHTLACIAMVMLAAASGCSDSTRSAPAVESSVQSPQSGASAPKTPPVDDPDYVLGFTAESITGDPVDLNRYRGKVVLVVNTASKCALTPQYEQLQELYEQHKEEGLVVLGFPSNDFNQETGSNGDIADFCDARYGVSFPMFAKVRVKGEDPHPLYAQLNSRSEEPTWNFTKYLIDRDGHFVTRFAPRTKPTSEDLVTKVRELLEQPAAG